MIGVVGPRDSVDLVRQVAGESGLSPTIITRTYESPREATRVAREIDPLCNVILFTGRVSFALALTEGSFRALLDYIPYTGVDLYPPVIALLISHEGRLPRVSLDTIAPAAVAEVFDDIALPPPSQLFSLDESGELLAAGDASGIIDFHLRAFRDQQVEYCLTCLDTVQVALLRAGVPVFRIVHTHATIRDSLRRASLASQLARSEGARCAALLVEIRGDGPHPPAVRARMREALTRYADRLRGTVTEIDESTFITHTTREAVENAVSRRKARHASAFDASAFPTSVSIAAGVATTVASAEECARRALQLARAAGEPHVFYEDGGVMRPEAVRGNRRVRDLDRPTSVAGQLGVGELGLARLIDALRYVDPKAVTANRLAAAQGIKPRSARRLLGVLEKAGLARQIGVLAGPTAGRPQTAWQVDMAGLDGKEP